MSQAQNNRPLVFDQGNQAHVATGPTELSTVILNDENGNPIYVGKAKPNTSLQRAKWSLVKIDYDSNNAVIRMTHPQNALGKASANFNFQWESATSSATITGITQALTGVVTVTDVSNLTNGDIIQISDVGGMLEVNLRFYKVANINLGGNTFELNDLNDVAVDTTGFSAYTSGGIVFSGNVLQYTYS